MSPVSTISTVPPSFPAASDLSDDAALSAKARGLIGSEILKISGEIRALQAAGHEICNLTVGDFSPAEFRIPESFQRGIVAALAAGETNYPPSDGILALRQSVAAYYRRELGLDYPVEGVVIAGGARPVIYATYETLVDPGEVVVYPTPSWNNNHYCYLSRARAVEVQTGPDTNFLPTAAQLRPHLGEARLLAINTPLNPTGTALDPAEVGRIAQLVVDENRRRQTRGARPLYLMWDQVYWTLTFGGMRHATPMEMVPESAAWTIVVDGISKSFAATGVRVGWAVGPPRVIARMRDVLGHVGAWAPRAEQVATAELLADVEGIASYHQKMLTDVQTRLDLLHHGFATMKRDGLPVDSVPPQGAIYLSARFGLIGCSIGGRAIATNEDIRRLLLEQAGFAVVPFQAFGLREENGWMRLSVGAVSPRAIEAALPRVRKVLEAAA